MHSKSWFVLKVDLDLRQKQTVRWLWCQGALDSWWCVLRLVREDSLLVKKLLQ